MSTPDDLRELAQRSRARIAAGRLRREEQRQVCRVAQRRIAQTRALLGSSGERGAGPDRRRGTCGPQHDGNGAGRG